MQQGYVNNNHPPAQYSYNNMNAINSSTKQQLGYPSTELNTPYSSANSEHDALHNQMQNQPHNPTAGQHVTWNNTIANCGNNLNMPMNSTNAAGSSRSYLVSSDKSNSSSHVLPPPPAAVSYSLGSSSGSQQTSSRSLSAGSGKSSSQDTGASGGTGSHKSGKVPFLSSVSSTIRRVVFPKKQMPSSSSAADSSPPHDSYS